MMIYARVMLDDDTHVASLWMRQKPAAGEFLWFGPKGSYLIKEIAHWVNETWTPNTHTGDPIHSIAVYVEKVALETIAEG
ncbi:MAG: hypothetical protein EON59_05690 [Alphaproteobacteria bacterium]|nr:MAG: hypothetical protein EON59_05690 [Alphaproteobacteria bacterium]